MYTDDPIIAVVGVARALRALRVWRALTRDVGLLMAIPEKRTLGAWARWLGALLFAAFGVVVIPKAKLLRATTHMRAAIAGTLDFSLYRSLVGMLEHFRCVNCSPPVSLQELYQPHREHALHQDLDRVVTLGPAASAQMREQLHLTSACGGAPFHVAIPALRTTHTPYPHIVTALADAATDSRPQAWGATAKGSFGTANSSPSTFSGCTSPPSSSSRQGSMPSPSPTSSRPPNELSCSTQRPQPRLGCASSSNACSATRGVPASPQSPTSHTSAETPTRPPTPSRAANGNAFSRPLLATPRPPPARPPPHRLPRPSR
eukprot:197672-Pleurochrysis_carterae.AAC.1